MRGVSVLSHNLSHVLRGVSRLSHALSHGLSHCSHALSHGRSRCSHALSHSRSRCSHALSHTARGISVLSHASSHTRRARARDGAEGDAEEHVGRLHPAVSGQYHEACRPPTGDIEGGEVTLPEDLVDVVGGGADLGSDPSCSADQPPGFRDEALDDRVSVRPCWSKTEAAEEHQPGIDAEDVDRLNAVVAERSKDLPELVVARYRHPLGHGLDIRGGPAASNAPGE